MKNEIFEGCFLLKQAKRNKDKAFLYLLNDENEEKLINPEGKIIDFNPSIFTNIDELNREWFNATQITTYNFETLNDHNPLTLTEELKRIKDIFLSTKDEDKPIILKHMVFWSSRNNLLEKKDRYFLNLFINNYFKVKILLESEVKQIVIYLKILIDHGYWSPRF